MEDYTGLPCVSLDTKKQWSTSFYVSRGRKSQALPNNMIKWNQLCVPTVVEMLLLPCTHLCFTSTCIIVSSVSGDCQPSKGARPSPQVMIGALLSSTRRETESLLHNYKKGCTFTWGWSMKTQVSNKCMWFLICLRQTYPHDLLGGGGALLHLFSIKIHFHIKLWGSPY